jgi:hypothetical protein
MNHLSNEIMSSKDLSFYKIFMKKVKSKKSCIIKDCVELGMLEYLAYAHKNGCQWDKGACEIAAMTGQLECLQYLHEYDCPWAATTAPRKQGIYIHVYMQQKMVN